MNFEPFHDNVFVEREEQEDKVLPSGIQLLKSAQDDPDTAIVIAVGPGRKLDDGTIDVPMVQPGDRVFIGRFAGTEINWNQEKRLVVPWRDILGRVRDDLTIKNKKKKTNKKID